MDYQKQSVQGWIKTFIYDVRFRYLQSIFFAILKVFIGIIPYYLLGNIISRLLQGDKDWHHYLLAILWMAGCWILYVLFHTISTSISHRTTFQVLAKIRRMVLSKLARIPLGDVLSTSSGAYKNIIVERIESMEVTLAHIIPEFTSSLLGPLIVLIYMLRIDWRIALLSLLPLPIGMIFFIHMMIVSEKGKYSEKCFSATKTLNNTAVEYINGIDVIKVFGKAKSYYQKFVEAAENSANSYLNWMRKCIVDQSFAMVILPSTLVVILPVGILFVMQGTLSIANLILLAILSLGLLTPIITMGSYIDDISKINVIFGEVTEILNRKDMQRPSVVTQQINGNDITFSHVSFGYTNDVEVLHDISLEIKANTVNALVGPSGSGKSTIAKLIASFWDPKQGMITFGGVNMQDIPLDEYNRLIAYVSQDNYLFNLSVMENIRLGKPNASDDEVIQAAKNCGCHDFIMQLDHGYQTIVGDAGGHLSGGERQRVAIARAILKDAPVIILDEATAYTDPENEALVQASLAKLVQGKTLLVIAHRLSTIANADQIILIHGGRVEAKGTHSELLKNSLLYQQMWYAHIQSKDTEEGEVTYA